MAEHSNSRGRADHEEVLSRVERATEDELLALLGSLPPLIRQRVVRRASLRPGLVRAVFRDADAVAYLVHNPAFDRALERRVIDWALDHLGRRPPPFPRAGADALIELATVRGLEADVVGRLVSVMEQDPVGSEDLLSLGVHVLTYVVEPGETALWRAYRLLYQHPQEALALVRHPAATPRVFLEALAADDPPGPVIDAIAARPEARKNPAVRRRLEASRRPAVRAQLALDGSADFFRREVEDLLYEREFTAVLDGLQTRPVGADSVLPTALKPILRFGNPGERCRAIELLQGGGRVGS